MAAARPHCRARRATRHHRHYQPDFSPAPPGAASGPGIAIEGAANGSSCVLHHGAAGRGPRSGARSVCFAAATAGLRDEPARRQPAAAADPAKLPQRLAADAARPGVAKPVGGEPRPARRDAPVEYREFRAGPGAAVADNGGTDGDGADDDGAGNHSADDAPRSAGAAAVMAARAGSATPAQPLAAENGEDALAAAAPRLNAWLLAEGRFLTDNGELFTAFCARIFAAGVPLDRASLHSRALHPRYRGVARIWRPGQPLSEQFLDHGLETTGTYIESPVRVVIHSHHRLDWRLDR